MPAPAQQAGAASAEANGEGTPADTQPASAQAEGGEGATEAQANEQGQPSAAPLKKFDVLYTQERSEKDKEVSQPSMFLCLYWVSWQGSETT